MMDSPEPQRALASAPPALPISKKLLFACITITVLAFSMEGVLRLVGYGGLPRFFQPLGKADGIAYYAATVDGLLPYFAAPTARIDARRVGSYVATPVAVPKTSDTLRIVVLGESSVQGFPWPRHLAAPGILQQILERRYPDRRVEVINAGVTAVGSFPVRRIAEETVALQPDAAVIYTGHNEFYGAFGVASSQFGGASVTAMRSRLWLRSTATVQALTRLLDRKPTSSPSSTSATRQLMEQMGARDNIGPEDPARAAAARVFESNLDAMVVSFQSASIPVVLCTIASNVRDLRPVRSAPLPSINHHEIEQALTAMNDAASSHPAVRLPLAEKVLTLMPYHAGAWYVKARCLDMQGQASDARDAYLKAREFDAMPWRAPAFVNQTVRRIASSRGVVVADVEARFNAAAHDALPGWDLFADHVHPSLRGQAVWALAMADALSSGVLPVPRGAQALPSPDSVTASPLQRWRVAQLMAGLFQRPPLMTDTGAASYWYHEQDMLKKLLPEIEQQVAARYVAISGGSEPITAMAAADYLNERRFAEAARYYEDAAREVPPLTGLQAHYRWQGLYSAFMASGGRDPGIKSAAVRSIADARAAQQLVVGPAPEISEALAGLSILAEDRDATLAYGKQLAPGSFNHSRLLRLAADLQRTRQRRTASEASTSATVRLNP